MALATWGHDVGRRGDMALVAAVGRRGDMALVAERRGDTTKSDVGTSDVGTWHLLQRCVCRIDSIEQIRAEVSTLRFACWERWPLKLVDFGNVRSDSSPHRRVPIVVPLRKERRVWIDVARGQQKESERFTRSGGRVPSRRLECDIDAPACDFAHVPRAAAIRPSPETVCQSRRPFSAIPGRANPDVRGSAVDRRGYTLACPPQSAALSNQLVPGRLARLSAGILCRCNAFRFGLRWHLPSGCRMKPKPAQERVDRIHQTLLAGRATVVGIHTRFAC